MDSLLSDLNALPLESLENVQLDSVLETFRSLEAALKLHAEHDHSTLRTGGISPPPPPHEPSVAHVGPPSSPTSEGTSAAPPTGLLLLPAAAAAAAALLDDRWAAGWSPQVWRTLGMVRRRIGALAEPSDPRPPERRPADPALGRGGGSSTDAAHLDLLSRLRVCAWSCADLMLPLAGRTSVTEALEKGDGSHLLGDGPDRRYIIMQPLDPHADIEGGVILSSTEAALVVTSSGPPAQICPDQHSHAVSEAVDLIRYRWAIVIACPLLQAPAIAAGSNCISLGIPAPLLTITHTRHALH